MRRAPSPQTAQTGRVPQLARRALWLLAFFAVLHFFLRLACPDPLPLLTALPLVFAALLVAASFCRPAPRILAAAFSLSVVLLCLLLGLLLDAFYGTAISQVPQNAPGVDSRTVFEVVRELRQNNPHVFPPGSWSARKLGKDFVALSSTPNRSIVWCNESGRYTVMDTDECGFLNPKHLWSSGRVDIAMLGDSFVHGGCVAMERSAAGIVRRRFPRTVNLGTPGFGPISELAVIREYGPVLRPRLVLWGYHDNDFSDLAREKSDPHKSRYLSPSYKQDLYQRRNQIEATLAADVSDVVARGSGWPPCLEKLGLQEATAPVLLRDLVLGTGYTRAARLMRLDQLYHRVRALLRYASAEKPDTRLMESVLRQAKREVEDWGGKLVFVYFPGWAPVRFNWHSSLDLKDRAFQSARAAGLPVIDLLKVMKTVPDAHRSLFFFPHSHYNEEGYRVAGETIVDFIARSNSLD